MDLLTRTMAKKYTDSQRLGYTETKQFSVIPKQEITLESNDEFGGVLVWQGGEGKKTILDIAEFFRQNQNAVFAVDVNDHLYEYEWSDDIIVGETLVLGNKGLMGAGDDTGEPFLFIISEGYGVVYENPDSFTSMSTVVSLTLKSETVHQIDKKHIPPLDSLTLNGADGKQYAITVNESGALVATPKT